MSGVAVGRAPVGEGTRLALVFGGTFDPPHRAHVDLARLARDSVGADVVLFVPAAQSPHKSSGPVASGADRVEMLRAAIGDDRGSAICKMELERSAEGPSYTVDTLRALRAEAPRDTALRLLIGADQAVAFHRWREPREIIRLAEPLVMLRSPYDTAESLTRAMAAHWSAAELDAWRTRVAAVPVMEAEATDVRELLRSGADPARLAALVPGPVLAFIRERGLYR